MGERWTRLTARGLVSALAAIYPLYRAFIIPADVGNVVEVDVFAFDGAVLITRIDVSFEYRFYIELLL